MPYCRRCGTKLEENAHFCYRCGTQVVTFSPPTPPNAITSPPTMRPVRNDILLVIGMVAVAIVISAVIIVAIFLVFHVNFGQTNPSQSNTNALYILYTILHRQVPLLNPPL